MNTVVPEIEEIEGVVGPVYSGLPRVPRLELRGGVLKKTGDEYHDGEFEEEVIEIETDEGVYRILVFGSVDDVLERQRVVRYEQGATSRQHVKDGERLYDVNHLLIVKGCSEGDEEKTIRIRRRNVLFNGWPTNYDFAAKSPVAGAAAENSPEKGGSSAADYGKSRGFMRFLYSLF